MGGGVIMENRVYAIADWVLGNVLTVVVASDGKTALAEYQKPVPEIPDYSPPCNARYRIPEIVSTTVAVPVPESWVSNPGHRVDPRRAEAVALAEWSF